ncbi:MAG: TonB-dependent receptor plug domain-containing protein [Gammaproteobacteria bacterium]|nr:TonB-dependent receptor plug domain-containing protein [Pseudomonadales bacterium]MCP5348506.1 TonB-dependent receptor plug domain-containing protein [Pseudomonadales bacterium]
MKLLRTFQFAGLLAITALPLQLRAQETTGEDSTVVYPASYFAEYLPVTVQDMLNRIPGVNVQGGGPRGSNASRGGRGLGSGGGGTEIMINGKRTAGKSNNSQSQLDRISADQVDYIEIIRGTSGELDVRGSDQIINVVLLEALSNTSLSYEANMDYYHDSEARPGGSMSYSGLTGDLNYLFSASAEPRYQHRELGEHSVLADGSPNDLIDEDRITEQTTYTLSSNLDYQFTERSSARFNALYQQDDNPVDIDRTTIDVRNGAYDPYVEREDIPGTQSNWEIGGDYEHRFENGNRFKLLGIANQNDQASTRERYEVLADGSENKNLFLHNSSILEERIVRGSYTMGLFEGQDVEFGLERAQTTLDSSLALATASSSGVPSPDHGGLVPVSVANANSTVEEIRYEPFAIHNWQINPRMTLETSLVYETSELTQSGDTSKQRSYSFVKPKVDYRFNITPTLQLRMMIEKMVRQLSFSDFTAVTDQDDLDADTQAGNTELRPDYWWAYNFTAEYRLPDDMGVLSANLYKHRHYDFRQRIDVSPSDTVLRSAWGNTGVGEMEVLDVRASVRLTPLKLPDVLVTTRASVRDSEVRDPLTGEIRSFNNFSKGNFQLGFRHDIPSLRMNYGMTINKPFNGDNKLWDLEDIEAEYSDGFAFAFVEYFARDNMSFRLDARNLFDSQNCRDRIRFDGRRSAGILEEVEYMCNGMGRVLTLRMSGTF